MSVGALMFASIYYIASNAERSLQCECRQLHNKIEILKQESHAVARKLRDAAAVLFGLKFVDNIHYKFKSSQASLPPLKTRTP